MISICGMCVQIHETLFDRIGPTTNATMSKRIAHFVVAFRFLWFELKKSHIGISTSLIH